MSPVRVLVVDDSLTMRGLISAALKSDPEIEVVGTAVNGKIALEKIAELKPDVVTLDLDRAQYAIGHNVLAERRVDGAT